MTAGTFFFFFGSIPVDTYFLIGMQLVRRIDAATHWMQYAEVH